jgi:hypothetical protein
MEGLYYVQCICQLAAESHHFAMSRIRIRINVMRIRSTSYNIIHDRCLPSDYTKGTVAEFVTSEFFYDSLFAGLLFLKGFLKNSPPSHCRYLVVHQFQRSENADFFVLSKGLFWS